MGGGAIDSVGFCYSRLRMLLGEKIYMYMCMASKYNHYSFSNLKRAINFAIHNDKEPEHTSILCPVNIRDIQHSCL